MTKDSYVPFIIASLTGLRMCHFPLYGDFQMPENTKKSDYQCETPKNWITGRPYSKLVGGNIRLKRTKFRKDTHALPRNYRDWLRVVATEVMQLSGGNVCAKLGFLKEMPKK